TAYRFARGLDDQYFLLADGKAWTREEWEERQKRVAAKEPLEDLPEPGPMTAAAWSAWLRPAAKAEAPAGADNRAKARFEKLAKYNEKLLAAGFFNGTNLGDAALSAVNREINQMVQGIVLFSDGRSTEGSDQAFRDLEQRAKAA